MSYDNEERLSVALRGIVGDRPYAPDLDQIESRGRKLRHRRMAWRATAGTSVAAAAIAAVAVATTGTGAPAPAPAPNLAAPKPAATGSVTAENAPLVQLVGYLTTAPKPKATRRSCCAIRCTRTASRSTSGTCTPTTATTTSPRLAAPSRRR